MFDIEQYLKDIKPQYHGYQELHVHSEYSFRDAANSIKDIFDAAEELKRNAVALTDHGNMVGLFEALKERTKREKAILKNKLLLFGASEEEAASILKAMGPFDSVRNPTPKMIPHIEKYQQAFEETAKEAVQFIPGIELYEGLDEQNDENKFHIILYAKDWTGMKELFKLYNLSQLNKVGDMPRCTMNSLRRFFAPGTIGHNHVICTTACIAGHIPSVLLQPHYLKEEISRLEKKADELCQYNPEVIAEQTFLLTQMQESLQKAKQRYADAKKLSKKKFASKIAATKKKLDKACAKMAESEMALSFLPDEENSPRILIEELKALLNELQEQEKNAQWAAEHLADYEQEVRDLSQQVKQKQEHLKSMTKANAPAERQLKKIEGLREQLNGVGDVQAEAVRLAKEYNNIFGQGNFYIEIQDHGILEELLIRNSLIKISKDLGIPMTVANDVHYKDESAQGKRKRDLIAAMRFNQPVEEVAGKTGNDQLWFKPESMIHDQFNGFPDVQAAMENTSRIAEACNVYYQKDMHLPEFCAPKGFTPKTYLEKMARQNIKFRYPNYDSQSKQWKKEFEERLRYELNVIHTMGYDSYICIVQDFIQYARENFGRESIGDGRGSGAGSLVNYLIGITNVDPLRYQLIFERFLNPERVSMPDIDTDFAPSIRDKVIDYVSEKYAYKETYPVEELKGTVCSINTIGTQAARGAIRSVGRVTGIPLQLCDRVAKMIPSRVGITIEKAMDENERLRGLYRMDPQVRHLIDDAKLVEGCPTQTGVHAAGVIISDKPISEYAPMFWNTKKNVWVIQADMVSCEEDIGLLKMDFLGLKNLDIIRLAKAYIKRTNNFDVDFIQVNKADDKSVIQDIYATGNTIGIFQFESGGMKQTLRNFAPESIDDIILLNAAYRPGPMDSIPLITKTKLGQAEKRYIVPEMAPILDTTYGKPIYQEQILQIFREIAGFSFGEADIIRRAMSKKHLNELEAAKGKFVEGFKAKGATPEDIEQFWEELLEFAKYAFNKSHAAAYSIVSYYTAWLKKYYPAEYMSALITVSDHSKVGLYVKNTKDMGLDVYGPDINKSALHCSPVNKSAIRIGLEVIKGIASNANRIVQDRKEYGRYKDLRDFIVRMALADINKTTIQNLAAVNALSSLGYSREQLLCVDSEGTSYIDMVFADAKKEIRRLMKSHAESEEEYSPEQIKSLVAQTMFTQWNLPQSTVSSNTVDMTGFLRQEKELVGYYISGHPLDAYKDVLDKIDATPIAEIDSTYADDKKEISVAGQITNFVQMRRKKDNAAMGKFTLEDLTDSMECICFVNAFRQYMAMIEEGNVVKLNGRIDLETDEENNVLSRQMIVTVVSPVTR